MEMKRGDLYIFFMVYFLQVMEINGDTPVEDNTDYVELVRKLIDPNIRQRSHYRNTNIYLHITIKILTKFLFPI